MSDAPRALTLTPDHVRRVERPVDAPLHDPRWQMLDDAALDALAVQLTEGRPRPVPVFAYGSLIWNPGFAVQDQRRARALGWHRQFSISLDHFRGSPDEPGLMLALASGGSCEGIILDVAQADEGAALRALLKRELVACELSQNATWIEVETDRGREQALTFYADPVNVPLAALSLDQQAQRLSRAIGPAGSGAAYLLQTAVGLEGHGIHDDYIWTLQKLVADEIDRNTRPA